METAPYLIERYGYTLNAFQIIYNGVMFTLEHHKPARPSQLVVGCCEKASLDFGLMASTVLRENKIYTSHDIGVLVEALVNEGLLVGEGKNGTKAFENEPLKEHLDFLGDCLVRTVSL